ncbi:MoaD/ThiS family protein [Aurantiacibacter sediminis]|uniref:MoaD/ThiS family protein n=1 Tax=Aurantiacibacter sediminis TaxID=2793064 RepID=A0ABS0N4A0_9SPHN|nr:MoaD/ThiS family protein [Aurantiacibacter sediminis]MBH5322090.1 MoaD/ThiS family protein [Aurantiacibacter sediminis]
MSITVVFLGKLADVAGEPSRELQAPIDWAQLISMLEPGLMAAIADDTVRVAVDGELLPDKTALSASDGAEVALLPPVSGG